MDRIQELREKRAKVIDAGRARLATAQKEGRSDLNAEEQASWDKHFDEANSLATAIDREERQRKLDAETRAVVTDIEAAQSGREPESADLPERYKAFRSLPTATAGYVKAFRSFLRGGTPALQNEEVRSLMASNDTLGGYLVAPMQFVARLIKAVDNEVFVRRYANVVPVMGALSLGVPTLETDADDATWTSEVATASEDTAMRYGGRELKPFPLAKLLKTSNKLLATAAIDPEALIIQRGAYKLGVTQEKAFLTGTGANQPLGAFTASSLGVPTSRDVSTGNTSSAITAAGLISAKYSLKAQYHRTARWLFHRDAVSMIAKLVGSDGQFLWKQSLREGEPDSLLGLPIDMSEYAPNTFTTGLYVGLLADWSNGYMIADSLNVQVQRLSELYAESNKTGFIFRAETDGMPVLAEAFARVTLA